MRINYSKKTILSAVLTIGLLLSITLTSTFVARAENVTLINETNPELTLYQVDGNPNGQAAYTPTATYAQNKNLYSMTSNSFVAWYLEDDISFAYKKYNFNYGSQATLTCETTITGLTGADLHENASVGLMIRSTLDPNGPMVFIHMRASSILKTVYRSSAGINCSHFLEETESIPIQVKLELKGKKVTAYYKPAGYGTWIKGSKTVPFDHSGTIYVGLVAHSLNPDKPVSGTWDGLNVNIQGPSEYLGDNGGGGETPTEPPEEVYFPVDPPVSANVLLRETFTEQDLIGGTEAVTNPLWKTDDTPAIVTEGENRRLYSYFQTAHYLAGNLKWTDYSTSVNLQFKNDVVETAENMFSLLLRANDTPIYGYAYYSVKLSNFNTLSINYTCDENSIFTTTKTLATTSLNYSDDKIHNLRVETLDNTITVYWDNQKMLSYTDTGFRPNLKGKIGFLTKDTSLYIDDITVIKMEDLLGGDYDNNIAGNYNQDIPDYIKKWAENPTWTY